MNIQIFGKSKCFDTKKAERWFKERGIRFQSIDLLKYGMSGGEFDSVLRAIGGIDKLIDWEKKHPQIDLLRYLSSDRDKEDKVFDDPSLMKTPIVRNGKKATVGYCPGLGWLGISKYRALPTGSAPLLLFVHVIQIFGADLKVRVLRQSLRDGREEVPRVRRALDLIRPVLIHHVEAVVRISGKCMDHRRFVIRKAAVLFLHFDHPLSVFSLFK